MLLHCERLANSGKTYETDIIDKCSYALNNFVELHYDKVTQRKVAKILTSPQNRDICKMLFEDSGRKLKSSKLKIETLPQSVTHLRKVLSRIQLKSWTNLVNTYYDNQIADFTQKNESESTSNKNREKRIENLTKSKNSTIESTARSEKEHVQIVAQIKANKDKQIADTRKVEFEAQTKCSYIM